MSDASTEKAAILMLALGQDEAAEVMKYLDPREVQKLGKVMSTMTSISHESLQEVLIEFHQETDNSAAFSTDPENYIRNVLNKALGDNKATSLLNRILITKESGGIESLKWLDGKAVAELVQFEHPQIIATILVHLEPYHASEVLTELSERIRHEVILRITTMESIQPAALIELNDVLAELLSGNETNRRVLGGIRATASIMNFMNSDIETSLMNKLKDFNADTAQKIMDQMFVFDDIVDIQDSDIQVILREVPSEALIIALKGTKDEVTQKILKNMSVRAAEMMSEDLEAKGPVRLSEVEKQQKDILQIIRRLSDEGQITLTSAGGDDAYV